MKLFLKNIGKIGEAKINIDGITVIAGENNSGKSTIGKSLYAIFSSFNKIERQIELERLNSVKSWVSRIPINLNIHRTSLNERRDFMERVPDEILSKREQIIDGSIDLKNLILNTINDEKTVELESDDSFIDSLVQRLREVLSVSDEELLVLILEKRLSREFYGQINNIYTEEKGEISLVIKNDEISVFLLDNHITDIKNSKNLSLHTDAIYIDDPFVIDNLSDYYYADNIKFSGHREELIVKLSSMENANSLVDEIVAKDKLQSIYDKINTVCSGYVIEKNNFEYMYRRKNSDRELNIVNLSTGLKTFVILKMLLEKGIVEANGTIILDEPEIHLHPEWQLLFAEIIVLIQKEFGMHILLNTHSPYFLNAIEVYSVKYGIDDKCNYYLASTENNVSKIEDVTHNIEKIYKKLARPLQDLENEVK